MILAYFSAPYLESYLQPMVNNFRDRVQSGDLKLTMYSIFFNNFSVAIMIYFGAIFLGLITAILLMINGAFIGYFATSLPLDVFFLLTLPHGIFEIPGILIAGAGGFTLFTFILYFLKDIFLFERNKWSEKPKLRERVAISFNNNSKKISQSLILLGLAIVLLIIGAFIEVYVTINLANYLIKIIT
ncbi:MAG: stage II sporulation protein M [Methanobrevibacter sp.]|nr:stage II sporulation protein M [Methanobrevibacter sp.]